MPESVIDYQTIRETLLQRMREPAPGRIQLLTGPRQVGKITLLLDIAGQFGDAAIYAAGDDPDAAPTCSRADRSRVLPAPARAGA